MGILDYVYRLKPEAGDTQPHNEIGGAQVLSGAPSLVDLGGGVMAWRFTAAGIATINARVMDMTGTGAANSGFTLAIRCAVETAPSQDSRLYCYSASTDPLLAGLIVRRGTTAGKRYSQLRGTSSNLINGAFTEWTPGAAMATDVIRVRVNDSAAVVPADNDALQAWFVGGGAGPAPDMSLFVNVGTNSGSYQYLHVNPSAGVMAVRDILVWHEELSDANCDALRDDLDAALTVAPPVITDPTGGTPGTTTITIGATSNSPSDGTMRFLRRVGGSAALATTIASTGESQAATANPQSRAMTAFTAGSTNNFVDMVQVGAGGNSNVLSYGPFTMASAGTAPSISVQPASQTVTAGAVATFNVTASGSGTLAYQWRFNGGNVGTNSSSYARTTVIGDNGGLVSVVVTGDTAPPATSSNATLTVNAAPSAGTFNLNSAIYAFKTNADVLLASAGVTFWASNPTTGALVGAAVTGLSTNASGIVTTAVAPSGAVAGTTYRLNYKFASGEYGVVELAAV